MAKTIVILLMLVVLALFTDAKLISAQFLTIDRVNIPVARIVQQSRPLVVSGRYKNTGQLMGVI